MSLHYLSIYLYMQKDDDNLSRVHTEQTPEKQVFCPHAIFTMKYKYVLFRNIHTDIRLKKIFLRYISSFFSPP